MSRDDRWIALAALGLAVVAASTPLAWRLADGPVGPVGGAGPPAQLWLGLAAGVAALAFARLRPADARSAAAWLLVVAAGLALVCWNELTADGVGPAPALALLGVLVAASSAAAHRRTG